MAEDLRGRRPFGFEEDLGVTVTEDAPAVLTAPVSEPTTPGEWVRQNLFSSWLNSLLTIVAGVFVIFALYSIINFVFVSAEWTVVQTFMKAYMAGPFPIEEVWRIWVCAT
jgi:hypothetical protein